MRTLDYILWYSKDRGAVKWRPIFNERATGDTSLERYDQIEEEDGTIRPMKGATDLLDGKLRSGLRRLQFT